MKKNIFMLLMIIIAITILLSLGYVAFILYYSASISENNSLEKQCYSYRHDSFGGSNFHFTKEVCNDDFYSSCNVTGGIMKYNVNVGNQYEEWLEDQCWWKS